MADVRLGRPAIVAIACAVVALVTSAVAVVVVMRREPQGRTPATTAAAPRDRTIDASDVLRLRRAAVDAVPGGVRVTDDALRQTFGLQPDDVITAINGRALKREFDLYDAVLGASTMNASIVYLEVTRGGVPALLRFQIEGELRTARRDTRPGSFGGNPFTAANDPLVDSIKQIDPLRFEIPKSTIDALLANPDTFMRQARIVPAVTNGHPSGFKLYAVRPVSVWAALGIGNGDTLRAINGVDLPTVDRILELYPRLKDATELRILVQRHTGVEDTLVLAIR